MKPLSSSDSSIFSRFVESAAKNSTKKAFIYCTAANCQTYTYADIVNKAVSIAVLLKNAGLTAGTRAAICAENSPQWCASYLAVTAAGGVSVPLDAELGEGEIRNLLLNSAATAIFTSRSTKDKVQKAIEGSGVRLISFDSVEFNNAWEDSAHTDIPPAPHMPDDIASIIYTSGTTSSPKGVILTHGNFLSDAESVIETKLITASDNVLSVLPLHHTYPFMCTFLVPLLVGATITYPPGLKGQELTDTIRSQGVTILIAIPRLLEMFLTAIEKKITAKPRPARLAITAMNTISHSLRRTLDVNVGRHFFKAVQGQFGGQFRFISSGGARLKPDVMTRLESYGFTVVEGYGLTETSPVVTFNPLGKRRPGSAGVPLKGVQISAPRKTGNAPPHEGEILIKGPMVTRGYLNMPEETEKAFFGGDAATSSGWFHSGDLGYIDEDGYLFITGRSKEVIVLSSGKNVYPEDVEQAYSGIALIKEIYVYSDAPDSDTIRAIIVPDMDYAKRMKVATVETAIKWEINNVSTGLPPYMRIKGFTLHSEPLPRTRLGKIQRFQMRAIATTTAPAAAPPTGRQIPSDPYTDAVISIIKELMALTRAISPEENLELDLGIDSLTRLELLGALEEHFKGRLPAGFGQAIHTVKELSDGLREFYEGAGADPDAATITDETHSGFKEMFSAQLPDAQDLNRIGLRNTVFERMFTRAVLWTLRQGIRRFYKGQLRGLENLTAPPYLICPNHTSYLDAFIMAGLLPWEVFSKLYFQGAEDIFRGALARVLARLGHVIPIDPNVNLEKAMAMSAYLLRQGLSLCIFPEGARSVDGTLQEFKKGVGILSKECGVPIIPARIDGAYEALPRGAFRPRPSRITLSCGKPIYPSGSYQSISDEVKAAIAEMERYG
ncbi:AMP-binding protein [Candidatus Magnetominusculus dajiuhuensis]|uniref:AMP-binding protein n=1 Tax=Candidatus Magnetominusculus dajiuhuensis TaxID=3137712 RepID=UPI003B42D972